MALFSICVSGYEEYSPMWFSGNCTKEEFKELSQKAINIVVKKVIKEENSYISGHNILDNLEPVMKGMGFEVVKPELEINIGGECLYSNEHFGRPKIFDDKTWNLIINHNENIDRECEERWKEKESKEKTKSI